MSRKSKKHTREAVHNARRWSNCLVKLLLPKRMYGEPDKRMLSYRYNDDK